jgi:glutamate-5-semialdehyde dehydrogenase
MSDEIQSQILDMGKKARAASYVLATLTAEQKNDILRAMADGIMQQQAEILEANAKDIAAGESNGLSRAMLDRLLLDPVRLQAISNAVREVARF